MASSKDALRALAANPFVPSAQTIDPVVRSMYADVLPQDGQTNRAPSQVAHDGQRSRATYDAPRWVIDAVAQIAKELQVPHGDVAAHLLASGLRAYKNGELKLIDARLPARSLRSEFKLLSPAR